MRRAGLLALVLAMLGVVYVAASRGQPAASAPAAQTSASHTADVASVSRSCPPPGPNAGAAHIAMIAMPAQAPAAKGAREPVGTAVLNAIPAAVVATPPATGKKHPATTKTAAPGSTPSSTATIAATKPGATASHPAVKSTQPALPVTVSDPGTPATVTAPGAALSGGTAVAATGEMAEGFEAEQATADGMGTVSCAHPGSDMWYVGTGAGAGAPDVLLYLMNTGGLPASVDVSILTDAGVQNGLGGAVTVAPRQVVTENLAPFVRGSQALALHVQTSSGQIAASVWEGGGSGGGSWLPQAAAPSTVLVIPGLTVASSAARLFVTVPGATDARFKVVAFTAQGRFPQFGSAPVDAPAAATSSFPLTSLGASAAALELISNVPITAGVLVPGTGIGSFTTAVAPVTEQGVVAGNPAIRGVTVGLVLTAPAASAQATVTVIPAGGTLPAGPGTPQTVTVPAGHTVTVTVPRPPGSRQPFSIVITPAVRSGPLYAARVVTTGTGGLSAPVISLLPVPSALTVISLPSVQNSYSAILPQP